jgi:exonuclease SbcC
MNRDKVLEIAQRKLIDLKQVDGFDVLRGLYKAKNNPVAVYYLDYSKDKITTDLLSDFQEKLLSTDYYNNSGFLQWNYYLLFIRESIEDSAKMEIEQNDIYSRKFLLTPQEFESFFSYQKSDEVVQADIVVQWKENLRNANLHEVFNRNVTYVDGVDNFVNNQIPPEEKIVTSSLGTNSVPIKNQHILQLDLKDGYRDFPTIRGFEFSKVNLINGVNGAGKTSLMEAIELVLCGKSDMHGKPTEKIGSISLSFKGGPIETFNPKDTGKFAERDLTWYNNDTYSKKTNLPNSFNRYNYFNSEAAYKLNTATPSEYKSLLEAIALGNEFPLITERLQGFRKRLRETESGLTTKRDELQRSVDNARVEQGKLSDISNSGALLGALKDFLVSISVKKALIDAVDSQRATFETALSKVTTSQQELAKVNQSLKFATASQFKLEETRVRDLIDEIDTTLKRTEEIKKENARLNAESDKLETDLKNLTRLREYGVNEKFSDLIGLDKAIQEMQLGVTSLKSLTSQFESIQWSIILDSKQTLHTAKELTLKALTEKRQIKNSLNDRLQNLKTSLDRLGQIESEIKALGKEYLQNSHDAATCPLCAAGYSHEELSRRINEIQSELRENALIGSTQDELNDVSQQIIALDNEQRQLSLIEQAILAGNDVSLMQQSIDNIHNVLLESVTKLSNSESNLTERLAFREQMRSSTFTESELQKLTAFVKNQVPSFSLEKGGANIDPLINDASNKKENLSKTLRSSDDEQNRLYSRLNSIASFIGTESDSKKIRDALESRMQLTKSAILFFSDLQNFATFLDQSPFSEIELQLKQAANLYQNYNMVTKQAEQSKVLKTIILNSTNELNNTVTPKLKRVQDGLGAIEKILDQDEKNKVLRVFFESNEQQIQDIFKRIHAPRELDKVLFLTQENNAIKIQRSNGKNSSIDEISSGQRSALALSIFLALNKKLKNGPNLLLFDDPVAFVDDLNVLSFLDYLREIVINEDRQIFFATANQKLAGFFDKKFSFLKPSNEFKSFALQR